MINMGFDKSKVKYYPYAGLVVTLSDGSILTTGSAGSKLNLSVRSDTIEPYITTHSF